MNIKKLIVILNILSIFILTGYKNNKDINYNSDIKVNGPSLKISLIQTAHEIYTTNIENSDNNSTYEVYIIILQEMQKNIINGLRKLMIL